jgi:competence protein ComEC
MQMFRHRPALLFAVALACGIYAESLVNANAALLVAVTIVLACLALLRIVPVAKNATTIVALVSLGSLLGLSVRMQYEQTPLARIAKFEKQVQLIGRIEDVRETETSYLASAHASSLALAGQSAVDVNENVLIRISKDGLLRSQSAMPKVGTTVKAYGTLEALREPTNPHEYASSLALQMRTETSCMLDVRTGFDLYILKYEQTVASQIGEIASNVHAWIASELDASIRDESSRGFVKAVVLGDRAEMERETVDNFTTAGVAHILAVSGFNVAIVALVFAQLLRLIGVTRLRARTIVTMLAVIAYAFIVGWQPSVSRAVLMIVLYLTATLLERKTDSLNIIASAAALELLVRPLDLFDVGFQLSYSAVLGLILIAPQVKRLLGRNEVPGEYRNYIDRFIDVSALSIGASVASYPVLASHFYRISLVGFAANLPIVPLSALINALGFLLIPIHAISPWLAHVYGDATTYLTRALFLLIDVSAHLPHAASAAHAPTALYLVLFVLCVTYLLRSVDLPRFVARLVLCAACYFALVVTGLPLSASVLERHANNLQVLFFDVGQGDCIYLRTPQGKSYFIDFGSADIYSASARAEQTALPFLRAEGETDVLGGFISHMHRDHFGGGSALLEHANMSEIFSSGERSNEALARSLENNALTKATRLRVLAAGDTIHLGDDVTLYTLHPTRSALRGLHTNYGMHANGGSLAFKVVHGSTSMLFLGDVEANDEREMMREYGDLLQSDVVKVAHHGSLTSSSKELTQATLAKYAVISVGAHNRFGHPAPAIVKRWMNAGARVLRTDRDGAILLVSDGERVSREDWR